MKNFSLVSHEDCTELVYNENNYVTGVCYLLIDRGESIMNYNCTPQQLISLSSSSNSGTG